MDDRGAKKQAGQKQTYFCPIHKSAHYRGKHALCISMIGVSQISTASTSIRTIAETVAITILAVLIFGPRRYLPLPAKADADYVAFSMAVT